MCITYVIFIFDSLINISTSILRQQIKNVVLVVEYFSVAYGTRIWLTFTLLFYSVLTIYQQ